jgi:hypothetical protein
MVAIIVIVVALIAAAIGYGMMSRRRAAERARVDRERQVIAGELSGHRQEQDAITSRGGSAADEARDHRLAAEAHEDEARRHEREAVAHTEAADRAEARFHRSQQAAARHGERAEDAQRRLDELEQR